MHNPQSPNAPRRRMGISERLGRPASTSPARAMGMGSVTLAIAGYLTVILSGYWQPSSVPKSTGRRDDSSRCGHSDQSR
jgi:hypothetical protein